MKRLNRGTYIVGLNLFVLTLWSSTFLWASLARANDVPQSFTLDGQLFSDATGTAPLLDSTVGLKIQILDEDKVCVLYEETQNVNTLASKGYFTVQVGSATGATKRTLDDSANTMAGVFQNINSVNGKLVSNGAACNVPPTSGDRRYVRIAVSPSTLGGAARTLSPDLTIDSVPNAVVAERAESIQGYRSGDLLKVNTAAGAALSQANLESLFSSTTRFNSLTAVVDGTSTSYMRSNSAAGANLPVLAGAPTGPAVGSIWYDSTDSRVKFQTGSGPVAVGTGGGSVSSVGFTAPAELSVSGAPITSSGTIAIAWASQTANRVFAAPNGAAGIPSFRALVAADVPFAVQNAGGTPSLQSGTDAGKGAAGTAGRVWIATDTRLIYRDTGAVWEQIAGAAAPTGTAGGDLDGSYPNPTVDGIRGVAISATTPTDGQVLRYTSTGTQWAPANFSVADLRTAGGAAQFASATCAASQTTTWSSLTNTFTCVDVAGLAASTITTGTIAVARLPVGTVAGTVAAGDDARITGAIQSGATAGGDLTGTYPNPTIAANAVTAAKIANDTITNAQISPTAAIVDTKLATISTAGKVSGGAITSGTIAGSTAINTSGAITTTGAVTSLTNSTGIQYFRENAGAGTNTVGIQAPVSVPTNYVMTLPDAPPASNGYVLSSTTAGVLSWIAPSSGSLTGTGTAGRVPYYTGASTLADSPLIVSGSNIGLGVTPTSPLHIDSTSSVATGAAEYGVRILKTYSVADTNSKIGIFNNTQNTNATGTVSSLTGYQSTFGRSGAGTTASLVHYNANAFVGAGTVANSYGYRVADATGPGVMNNQYGLYVDSLVKGDTNNFAVFTAGTTKSYFGGNVGIGVTNPGAMLQVGEAGTSLGTFRMTGNTSGYVQIQPAAAAGSWTMTLPAGAGTNGQVLTTNGSGVTSWTTVSAGGITSLGGQTGGTQTFSAGAAGNAPAIASAGDVHTLNVPLASASGTVTSGTISNADYVSFSGKLTSPLTTKGDILVRNATVEARLPVGADGQVVVADAAEATGLRWTNFSAANLRTAGGAAQFASATCSASQTTTWSSLTNTFTCVDIAGLAASTITSGTIDASRLPASVQYWAAATGGINYAGGNVGIGTASPATKLDVTSTSGSVGITTRVLTDTTDYIRGINSLGATGFTIDNDFDAANLKLFDSAGVERTSLYSFENAGPNLFVFPTANKLDNTSNSYGSGIFLQIPEGLSNENGIFFNDGDVSNQPAAAMTFFDGEGGNFGVGGLKFKTSATTGNMTTRMTINPNGNVGIGSTAPGALLQLGTAGTSLGTFRMTGNTSGYVQIQPAAAAGSWTMTLPATAGTSGQALTTNGSGVTTWTTLPVNGGTFLAGNGSNAAPSFSFSSDTDTGIYRVGSNQLGFSAGGTLLATISDVGGASFNDRVAASIYGGSAYAASGSGANPPDVALEANSTNGVNSSYALFKMSARNAVPDVQNFYMATIANASGYTPSFAMGQQTGVNSYAERLRIDTSGNVGIGATAPGALLQLGTAGTSLGTFRMTGNTSGYVQIQPAAAAGSWTMTLPAGAGTNGQVLTTNGSGVTSWTTVSAGGITSLGGQTGATQTFAAGAAGNAPAIASAGNTHTLNVPLASASGTVTSGTISNADYVSFAAKLTSPLTTKGDLLTRNATVEARLPVGTDGQVLVPDAAEATGLKWTNFSAANLRTAGGASQFASATCSASQTTTWSSLTNTFTCVNIAGLDAATITTGTIDAARLPASAQYWEAATGGINYAGGLVGIGTTTPTAPLTMYSNNTAGMTGQIRIQQDGTGDALMQLMLGATSGYAFGVDNSDGDKLKIGSSSSGYPGVDAGTLMTWDKATGYVGIGTANPAGILDVRGGTAANATNGTNVNIYAQNAGSGNQNGGSIRLKAGDATGSGSAGNIYLNNGVMIEPASGTGHGFLMLNANDADTSGGADLRFNASRTGGSAPTNGTYLGQIIFQSSNGGWRTSSRMFGVATETHSGTASGGALKFETTPNTTVTPQTRMTIDQNGNVGIGTEGPGALLQLGSAGTSLGTFRLAGNTSGYVQLQTAAAAGSWTMTLPATAGTTGQALTTNGSGVTTWTTVPANGGTFLAADGTAAAPGFAFNSSGNTDNGMFLPAANQIAFSTAGSERIRIDASGNIGVGTSSPGTGFNIHNITNGATNYMSFTNPSTGVAAGAGLLIGLDPADEYRIQSSNSTPIKIHTSGVERVRFAGDGTVGIGSNNPGALLQLGTAGTSLGTFRMTGNTSGYVQLQPAAAAGSWTMTLPAGAGSSGQALTTNGSGVTSWTTVPANGGTFLAADGTQTAPGFGFNSSGNGDNGMFLPAANQLAFTTAGSERVRIDASGLVGVGTTSPQRALHVQTNVGGLRVERNSHNFMDFEFGPINTGDTTDFQLTSGTVVPTGFSFRTWNGSATVNAMGITNTGNVGIATVAPGALLQVGTAGTSLGTFRMTGNTSGYVQLQPAAAAGSWTMTLPATAGTNGQALTTNGSGVTTWSTVPANGGTFLAGAGATATPSISFNGDTNTGFYSYGADEIGITVNGVDSGVIGNNEWHLFRKIWTGNCSAALPCFSFSGDSDTGMYPAAANIIGFSTNGAERVRISAGGQLSIGNTSTTHAINVTGSAGLSTGTAWTNTSDARLKDVHGNYEYGLDEILKLNTVRFNYKKDNALGLDSSVPMTGFVAQEVQKVIPDAVTTREDGYLELNVDPIHWAVVNAVKEMYQRLTRSIASVETEVEKLRSENENLKSENAAIKAYLCEKDPGAKICQ